MRTQDIKIGELYRHRDHPDKYYARAIKIHRPLPAYRCRNEFEKRVKNVVVEVEWTQGKNDTMGFIKYFRPCDLIMISKGE